MDYSISEHSLQDRVILITGAGAGIGKEAAIRYAQYGATVILLGRTLTKLQATQQQIHEAGYPTSHTIEFDLQTATKSDHLALADNIEKQFGRLDGILHNAGLLGVIAPFEEIDERIFDDLIQVNLKSEFLMTQACLPLLRKSPDARLVFTSSTVGHIGRAEWGMYAISKFAVEGMMQVLADELKTTNIRVNAINPGGTRTSMRAQAFPVEDPNTLKTPEDIIPLYLYLMAPESRDVHGQCIDAQPKK